MNFPDVQAGFRKGRGTRDQIVSAAVGSSKRQESSKKKKIYFCFIGYAKTFDSVDHKKTGKSLKGWEYQTILHASWETCMQAKKQQLELVM